MVWTWFKRASLRYIAASARKKKVLHRTKVGRVYKPVKRGEEKRVQWVGGQNFEVSYDYSAAGWAASYTQSQLRLGQSSIDALIIHDLDQEYHRKKFETYYKHLNRSGLSYLNDLKSSGEISPIGMGINALIDFEFFAGSIDLVFSLLPCITRSLIKSR